MTLGANIVKNLSKDLPGQEIQQLIAKHGVDVVEWTFGHMSMALLYGLSSHHQR